MQHVLEVSMNQSVDSKLVIILLPIFTINLLELLHA